MAESISLVLRREVRKRAGARCEYCLMPETELFAGCQVDHVISRKHGGVTNMVNLALSCERCNRAKGQMSVRSSARSRSSFGCSTRALTLGRPISDSKA